MTEALLSLRIIKSIIGVLGMFGNLVVCVVIFKVRSMHTLTNVFIANQAVVDFFGSLMLLLSSTIPAPPNLDEGLAVSWLLCRLWISDILVWAFFTASTFNLVAVTLERYCAIVFPFRYQATFERCKATTAIVCVWVLGLSTCAYGAAIHVLRDGQCLQVSIPGAQAIGVLYLCLQYFLPAAIMVFAYTHIAIVLKRNATRVGPLSAGLRGGRTSSHNPVVERADEALLRARRNTIKTLAIVSGVYVICWTPSSVIFFMYNFGWPLDFRGPLYIISTAMVASNSCANPFIYALKYRHFRSGARHVLGIGGRAGQAAPADGEVNSYETGFPTVVKISANVPQP